MSRNRKLQAIVVLSALVLQLMAGALPALAVGELGGTASVNVHEVLSGSQTPFIFTITNTGDPNDAPADTINGEVPDPSVRWVRIGPMQQRVGGTLVPANSGAAGWTGTAVHLDGDNKQDAVEFKGGTLAAGDTLQFTVWADASHLPADRAIDWKIELSDSPDGDTITEAGAVAPGDLTTGIRVLDVETVTAAAPNGVIDNSATADQSNLVYETKVTNYASVPLPVTPTLRSSDPNDTIGTQGVTTINPNASATFNFPVDLSSSTATRTITGDAVSGTAANAGDENAPPLTVQPAPSFAYGDNSLQPMAAVSGVTKTFVLSLTKSNPPSVALSPASTLTFTKGSQTFSTHLAAITPMGAGNDTKLLTFAPVTIPGSPLTRDWDGLYTPTLSLVGTDGNDASLSTGLSNAGVLGADQFEIDNLIPDVDADILPPKRTGTIDQVDANGTPVAKDGQSLKFGGAIKKTAGGLPDTTAMVTACYIVYKVDGVEQSRSGNLSGPNCTNAAGSISGSGAAGSTIPESLASLAVVVTDLAGNATVETQSLEAVRIDNKLPTMAAAFTGCGTSPATGCKDLETIRVNFSEPVIGDFQPFDFLVDGNPVLSAAEANCTTQGTVTFCRQVVLTLLEAFAKDDKPVVDYQFRDLPPMRAKPVDAPSNQMPLTKVMTAIDGILPDLPTLTAVSQDGQGTAGEPVVNNRAAQPYGTGSATAFYTNQGTPTFSIGNVADGYRVIVALDTNGIADYQDVETVAGGVTTPPDQVIASCLANAATNACTATSALAPGDYNILVAAKDAGDNLSMGRDAMAGKRALPGILVIDNTAPAATGFAPVAATKDITASFDEALGFGRNTAADWIARKYVSDDDITRFTTQSVTGTGASRVIRIGSATYVAGDANQLLYSYQGPANNRYQDRAGNYLGNVVLTLP